MKGQILLQDHTGFGVWLGDPFHDKESEQFVECPTCKAQMRICAFIQDAHAILDIMEAQGIADFRAPPPIPNFIDTSIAIDELPSYDSFEPSPDDF